MTDKHGAELKVGDWVLYLFGDKLFSAQIYKITPDLIEQWAIAHINHRVKTETYNNLTRIIRYGGMVEKLPKDEILREQKLMILQLENL
jgi:hypothetical protein